MPTLKNQLLQIALKAGYCHIVDTSRIYGTDMAAGSAIKKSGIPRGLLFITIKGVLMLKGSNGKMQRGAVDYVETYMEMEKFSNFSKGEIERLLSEPRVVPAAYQIELHPRLQQQPFTDFPKQKGIHITQREGCLAWSIAKGHSVIPKSKTKHHIKLNLESDFKLPRKDIKKLDSIDKTLRSNDPSKSFQWDLYSDLDREN
ncbi:Aldo/keto reductase [Lindgomyces ingoldianus]|uniref:Aldo/keto reductase n=1 Tax=Lindgomyces ingoldianus TaxID=673940 RepID=A0ACB6QZA3_9PLEO|nr:Aldo/keto reductase [Lindgomyces ingoldianus]KAF2472246.1 Aldo/keto reductase [Lindgomyces ingoldianus]